jgi:hypothetical protein
MSKMVILNPLKATRSILLAGVGSAVEDRLHYCITGIRHVSEDNSNVPASAAKANGKESPGNKRWTRLPLSWTNSAVNQEQKRYAVPGALTVLTIHRGVAL